MSDLSETEDFEVKSEYDKEEDADAVKHSSKKIRLDDNDNEEKKDHEDNEDGFEKVVDFDFINNTESEKDKFKVSLTDVKSLVIMIKSLCSLSDIKEITCIFTSNGMELRAFANNDVLAVAFINKSYFLEWNLSEEFSMLLPSQRMKEIAEKITSDTVKLSISRLNDGTFDGLIFSGIKTSEKHARPKTFNLITIAIVDNAQSLDYSSFQYSRHINTNSNEFEKCVSFCDKKSKFIGIGLHDYEMKIFSLDENNTFVNNTLTTQLEGKCDIEIERFFHYKSLTPILKARGLNETLCISLPTITENPILFSYEVGQDEPRNFFSVYINPKVNEY
jgi:hypothetical protein